MLGNVAAYGVFTKCAAAPPHLARERRGMRPAAPVVVLILNEVLVTVLALLLLLLRVAPLPVLLRTLLQLLVLVL
jgi:hypothetical protein